MGKKKDGNRQDERIQKILLATAVIELIKNVIELITKLIE